jgi:hypothetical protein
MRRKVILVTVMMTVVRAVNCERVAGRRRGAGGACGPAPRDGVG